VLLSLRGIDHKSLTLILALNQCLLLLELGILIFGILKIVFLNRAQFGVNKPIETYQALLSKEIEL
jgi:hypothetical protein